MARSDQRNARESYLQACKGITARDHRVHMIEEQLEKQAKMDRPEPAVELEEVPLEAAYPEKTVRLGLGLATAIRSDILQVLRDYQMVFAWGTEDMPGVDRAVITHKLSVDPAARSPTAENLLRRKSPH